jgi:hypothetical protein
MPRESRRLRHSGVRRTNIYGYACQLAGSWKGAYGYAGTYKLKPDAPDADDAVRTLSSFYVPAFEKMLA